MRATFAINSAARRIDIGSRSDHFVKLAAFDELHAEVAMSHRARRPREWEQCLDVRGWQQPRLPTKSLQMRFRGPMAQADHFERDGAIETFLSAR